MATATRIPFEPRNATQVRRNLERTLKEEAGEIAKEYRKTVRYWRNKPTFKPTRELTGGSLIIIVAPTGDADAINHYEWTDLGTEPHIIRAKNKPRLLYAKTFTPKTMPGVIGSGRGSRSGPYGSPEAVDHPGTRARRFTVTIMDKSRRKRITQRLREAAKPRSENGR